MSDSFDFNDLDSDSIVSDEDSYDATIRRTRGHLDDAHGYAKDMNTMAHGIHSTLVSDHEKLKHAHSSVLVEVVLTVRLVK